MAKTIGYSHGDAKLKNKKGFLKLLNEAVVDLNRETKSKDIVTSVMKNK